jgi:hypothetical protein
MQTEMVTMNFAPIPIFVSSAHYGLEDLRGELTDFLRTLGAAPFVSSEAGFPDYPGLPPYAQCLRAVELSLMVVGIIDRRYGSTFDDWGPYVQYNGLSPTHAELRHAIASRKRLLIYVRNEVQNYYEVYRKNKVAFNTLAMPIGLDIRSLELFEELKHTKPAPWIEPFRDVRDIKESIQRRLLQDLYQSFCQREALVRANAEYLIETILSMDSRIREGLIKALPAQTELELEQLYTYVRELGSGRKGVSVGSTTHTVDPSLVTPEIATSRFEAVIQTLIPLIEAESQRSYLFSADQAIADLRREAPSVPEDFLRFTAKKFGAGRYALIQAKDGSQLQTDVLSPGPVIDWEAYAPDLSNQIAVGETRTGLIPVLSNNGTRNLLFVRLGVDSGSPDWRRAIVFLDRDAPPLKGGPRQFLTLDFLLAEEAADLYITSPGGTTNAPLFLLGADTLRRRGMRLFGGSVALTIRENEYTISGGLEGPSTVTAREVLAENSIVLLFGAHLLQTISLEEISRATPDPIVSEFQIMCSGIPVQGQNISVRCFPDVEVTLPAGWWWLAGQDVGATIEPTEAAAFALRAEQENRPCVHLSAKVLRKVILPEVPNAIFCEIEVKSEMDIPVVYLVNTTGEIHSRTVSATPARPDGKSRRDGSQTAT